LALEQKSIKIGKIHSKGTQIRQLYININLYINIKYVYNLRNMGKKG